MAAFQGEEQKPVAKKKREAVGLPALSEDVEQAVNAIPATFS
jgi:hypothetical protein